MPSERRTAVAEFNDEVAAGEPVPAGIGPDYIARGFEFCIIEDWNILPVNFFTDSFDIAHLQSFRFKMFFFLGRQPTPLKGEAA